MNDPRSSNGRGGAAKQATATVSDLGTERGEWKDLGEVSRGQQNISQQQTVVYRKRGKGKLSWTGFRSSGSSETLSTGSPFEQARRLSRRLSLTPSGCQASPCRKSLRVKLPFGHKIEHPANSCIILPTVGLILLQSAYGRFDLSTIRRFRIHALMLSGTPFSAALFYAKQFYAKRFSSWTGLDP